MAHSIIFRFDRVTVIQSEYQADYVTLHGSRFPSPFPKVEDEKLTLSFAAEKGKGAEYVRNHFGIDPEVIKS